MRRMYSDGQVVKVVNKAIDDGEIQAGGLTPEQEEKLDNSLQLPESAPAAQQLVGINTSGEQNFLNIGDGLEINDGILTTGLKKLVLNFNNSDTLSISDQQYANIITKHIYDIVIVLNTLTKSRRGIYLYNGTRYISISPLSNSEYSSMIEGIGFTAGTTGSLQLEGTGSAGSYSLRFTLSNIRVVTNFNMAQLPILNPNGSTTLPSGETIGLNVMNWNNAKIIERLYLRDGQTDYIWLHSNHYDTATQTLYLSGETASYKYECTATKWASNQNYAVITVTKTAK